MSTGQRPDAANTAREAAQAARELADFLDEYAEHLAAPDHEQMVKELREVIVTRLHNLRHVIRLAHETKT